MMSLKLDISNMLTQLANWQNNNIRKVLNHQAKNNLELSIEMANKLGMKALKLHQNFKSTKKIVKPSLLDQEHFLEKR